MFKEVLTIVAMPTDFPSPQCSRTAVLVEKGEPIFSLHFFREADRDQ
jgi:hypothetical protein